MPERLADPAHDAAALLAAGWTLAEDGRSLARTLRFEDFAAAFAFLTRVALIAQRLDHHPDWSQRWNQVELTLTTHAAGGLTRLDLDLAAAIDRIPQC